MPALGLANSRGFLASGSILCIFWEAYPRHNIEKTQLLLNLASPYPPISVRSCCGLWPCLYHCVY
jgi:hypothetical protein